MATELKFEIFLMSIPRSFIDDILVRVDIVEIIGTRIRLRKAGSNFVAPCPFHNEKTPSFSINQAKQFYYCFGCGAHGDAIKFLMDFDHLDFIEAVKSLAAHLGLEVPDDNISLENQAVQLQHKKSYDLLAKTSVFYQQQLGRSTKAKNYVNSRGLSEEICRRFMIGYAPAARSSLLQAARLAKADVNLLCVNGLLVKNDAGELHDRFRDRIIFPIRNRRGNVIAFGGRCLGNDLPKYLNSPETELFHKGDELYGLYEARHATQKLEKILVVEGYMDVVALAQYGINYAVATMGTAITPKQVQLMLREAEDIVFCFDGDNAGHKAAWRALEIILPLMRDGLQARFLFLPAGEDPDSCVRKEGQVAFLNYINSAMPLSDFLFKRLGEQSDVNTIDGRSALVRNVMNVLHKMPQSAFKEMLLQKLAVIVRMDIATLKNLNLDQLPSKEQVDSGKRGRTARRGYMPNAMEVAINLLLHHPRLVREVPSLEKINKVDLPYKELLFWLIKLLQQKENISLSAILEQCQKPEDVNFLAQLAVQAPLIAEDGLKNEFLGVLQKLYLRADEREIELLLRKAHRESLSDDEKCLLQKLIAATRDN